jgi:CheY-like chemotaxis protein
VSEPAEPAEVKDMIDRLYRARQTRRVLLVDDSPVMRGIVRKILAASRFRLDLAEAAEGHAALQQIRNGGFDLVLLDYNMPGLNGEETLAEIRREHPHLEVVMISSTANGTLADRARAAGAAAFLKKPFYPADMDAVLERLFGFGAGTAGR